jgi:hypothetical protein
MGVAHGTTNSSSSRTSRRWTITSRDRHPVSYTNVFWGGRSEIKPSEISPIAYRAFCASHGIDPESMRECVRPSRRSILEYPMASSTAYVCFDCRRAVKRRLPKRGQRPPKVHPPLRPEPPRCPECAAPMRYVGSRSSAAEE